MRITRFGLAAAIMAGGFTLVAALEGGMTAYAICGGIAMLVVLLIERSGRV